MTTQPSTTDQPRWWQRCGDSRMGLGLALGVALGAALDNLAMGMALGVVLGFFWDAQRRR